MKVMLVNPPTEKGQFIRTGRWTRRSRGKQQWYPIWLAYAAGLLQREGHDVLLLDAEADGFSFAETLEIIRAFEPMLTVVYFCQDSMENDVEFSRSITDTQVVLAGPSAEFFKEDLLNMGIKLLARGEFDYTILELAEERTLENIKGLSWLDETVPHHNPPRELCNGTQLEEDFPFVTSIYEQFLDIRRYHQASFKHPFVDTFSGRGCSWGLCTFCLWTYGFNQGTRLYRTRSVQDVVEELRFIKTDLPEVKQVFFQDETLPEWRIEEISNGILDAKLNICWGSYARPEISYKALRLAKKSGCRTLHVGFESCNKASLKAVKKGVSVERMEQFAADARKAGIRTSCNFILGLPCDTEEGIRKTVEWVKHEIRPSRVSFAYLQVYKGTPIYNWLEERGWLANNKFPNHPHLSYEKIMSLEKWALKEYYLKNPRWITAQLINPAGWRELWNGFVGFMQFLRESNRHEHDAQ